MFFQKIAFRSWHRFLIDFGANLPPFFLPKSTKILPKIDPKMHQFFDWFLHRFFIDFGSILEANLGPCWPHFPPKWGDLVARRPLFCWVYLLFRFFGRPGPLLAPSGLDLGGFGPPFSRFLIPIFFIISKVFDLFFSNLSPMEVPWLWMGWWGYAKR